MFLSRRISDLNLLISPRLIRQEITICSSKQPYSNMIPFICRHLSKNDVKSAGSHRYQHSAALETLHSIRKEKKSALNQIDEKMKHVPGNITRMNIEDEIQAAAMRMEDFGNSEEGPSGKYEYYFHDSVIGSRSYRRRNLISGDEQPVFSTNFYLEELGPMSLSVDEDFAARLITFTGQQGQQIVVTDINTGINFQVDIRTGGMQEDGITRYVATPTVHNVEFGPTIQDANVTYHTLFFTICDSKGRPNAVYGCIFFGNKGSDDKPNSRPELVLIDHEGSNFVDVQRTKGCKYVAIHSTSKTSNEIFLVGKDLSPKLVRRRQAGIQYFLDCGVDDDVIIMAQRTEMSKPQKEVQDGILGNDFKVYEVKVNELPLGEDFGEEISANFRSAGTGDGCDFFIEDMDIFVSHICFYERSFLNGTQRVEVYNRKRGTYTVIPSHDAYCVITPAGSINYLSSHFSFNVESPVKPPVSLQYDFDHGTGSKAYVGERKVQDDYPYTCDRVLIESHDGTKCPLSIVYNKSVKMSSVRPVVLVGYNCYGQNQSLLYDPIIMPLVDRGFAIVSQQETCPSLAVI